VCNDNEQGDVGGLSSSEDEGNNDRHDDSEEERALRVVMSKTASARFYRSSKNRVSFQQGVLNLINF